MPKTLKVYYKYIFFNVIIIINFLTPYTQWAYFLQLFCLLFLIIFFRSSSIKIDPIKILLFIVFILAFLVSTKRSELVVTDYLRILNLFILVLFFPITDFIKIKYWVLHLLVYVIFFSQIVFILKIFPIIQVIENFYPAEVHFNPLVNIGSLKDFSGNGFLRYGGLYMNSNHAGKFLTLILAVFLIEQRGKSISTKLFFIIPYILAIFLTGSRTAFLASIILSLFYFWHENKFNKKTLVFVIITFFIISVLISFEFRIASLFDEDLPYQLGSLSEKSLFLKNYLFYDSNLINLLFGNFTIRSNNYIHYLRVMDFDSGIGYLIYSIGFFGLLLIIAFFVKLIRNSNFEVKIITIVLIWTVSSTILLQFKMSFLFFMLLSSYYCQNVIVNKPFLKK